MCPGCSVGVADIEDVALKNEKDHCIERKNMYIIPFARGDREKLRPVGVVVGGEKLRRLGVAKGGVRTTPEQSATKIILCMKLPE